MTWIRRGSALAVLLLGWIFILVANNFHVTPPVVMLGLGFFAAVAAVYTLFRTGSSAVAGEVVDLATDWERPAGAAVELEREKRALLKAIKEAEFDHLMGKLSKADADQMINGYRARAIEVIKELDVLQSASGEVGSVREQILREARARVEIETKARASAKPKGAPRDAKAKTRAAGVAADAKPAASADAKPDVVGEGNHDAPAAEPSGAPDDDELHAARDGTDATKPGSKEAVS